MLADCGRRNSQAGLPESLGSELIGYDSLMDLCRVYRAFLRVQGWDVARIRSRDQLVLRDVA